MAGACGCGWGWGLEGGAGGWGWRVGLEGGAAGVGLEGFGWLDWHVSGGGVRLEGVRLEGLELSARGIWADSTGNPPSCPEPLSDRILNLSAEAQGSRSGRWDKARGRERNVVPL